MSDKEIMDALKDASLPTFGTKLERENRLRKAWGKYSKIYLIIYKSS